MLLFEVDLFLPCNIDLKEIKKKKLPMVPENRNLVLQAIRFLFVLFCFSVNIIFGTFLHTS